MHNRYHISLCRTNTLLHNTTPLHTKHNMCTQNGNLTLQNNTHLRPNLVFTQSVSRPLPPKTKLFATIQQQYPTLPHYTIACYKILQQYFYKTLLHLTSVYNLFTQKNITVPNDTKHCFTFTRYNGTNSTLP